MNKCFLYEMLRTASPSGQEFDLQKKVMNYMRNQCHEVRTDLTGNVISVLNPESPVRVLLAGHIDEIAMMVTMVTSDGLLKVTNVGGVRPALYLGQKVRILTEKGMIKGIVGVNKGLLKNKELSCTDLFIDLGVNSKDEALALVELGNLVIIDTDFEELSHGRIAGRAMDNRIGAFIVIEALRRARELGASVGIYAATTVGEETTMRGAQWAGASVKPTLALVVDVTFASDYPGTDPESVGEIKLGAGPVLCNSSIVNNKINSLLKATASQLNMSLQYEAAPGRTGTDADRIHFAHEGIPLALVSIPLRYMHSPNEMVDLKDVDQIIELLAHFMLTLNEDISYSPYDVTTLTAH